MPLPRPAAPASIGHTGSTEVPDAGARTQHEVDVLAFAPGEISRKPTAPSP
ncbi:hypothetical protein [Streptomyces marincola]|uniref:hypothetical protein n=1 Tax=Streptomyces marincola TaxID=2878388 RepID=UPI001CF30417|nr:hypothetical protein [Streptomyces marincola]UCM88865.1 hypothetical protein LC193_13390 [Streptomyces marincola]